MPVAVLGALGIVLAPSEALVPALVAVPMTAAMIGFVVVVSRADLGAPVPMRRAARCALFAAGVAVASTLAVAGLIAVVGEATGPILLLVAFGVVIRLVFRYDRPAGVPVEANLAPGTRPLVRVLASLSTPALCAEWQRSLSVLHAAAGAEALADVADLRRCYLDELERRDPGALARWLATDARPAATSPRRHLSG